VPQKKDGKKWHHYATMTKTHLEKSWAEALTPPPYKWLLIMRWFSLCAAAIKSRQDTWSRRSLETSTSSSRSKPCNP
jgi:hypothetical protein